MNQDHTLVCLDTRSSPLFQKPSELGHVIARARQQRAEMTAAMIGSASRGMVRALRLLPAQVVGWRRRRATRDALRRCSDRVLADIGIARENIPLVAKGIDAAQYHLRNPALRRWWAAVHARLDAIRAARRERRRIYRELDAYDGGELDEVGLRRADIPVIARGQSVDRRAA